MNRRRRSALLALIHPLSQLAIILLSACSSRQLIPLDHPVEIMSEAWGPFARQCTSTHVSYWASGPRGSPTERTLHYRACIGFAAQSDRDGSISIAASMEDDHASQVTIRRLQRPIEGKERAASVPDNALLAQESENSNAQVFASLIGVTKRQEIRPAQVLDLPVVLTLPSPIHTTVSCQPDGASRIKGRETVLLACAGNDQIHTATLVGRMVLAGVIELDVRTGIRLAARLAGHLDIEKGTGVMRNLQHDTVRLLYNQNTETESQSRQPMHASNHAVS